MFRPPVMFTATGMIVGVLVLGANSSLAQGNVENNIDRPGADYKNFNLPRPDYRICKQACEDDGRCQAWTYVKPGIQGRSARCWLKVKVPRARASNCCISGQKTGRGFSWHFANLNKINPRGDFSRHQYPDGTYDVWQNGGHVIRERRPSDCLRASKRYTGTGMSKACRAN